MSGPGTFDGMSILRESGAQDDSELDLSLFKIALAFCAPLHVGISADRYFNHVKKMADDARLRNEELIAAGAEEMAGTQLAALKYVLYEREQYIGDAERYDDLDNADMMRVIDRRKGLPISLCILYIHVGRMNGWHVDGLNFPGHFLCRIELKGERLIFDPFDSCKTLDAPDLRQLLKRVRGESAELSADYYKPCTNRETLVRLQNNVKLRLIDAEEYKLALRSVEMMRMLDPQEYRLMLDAGVLYAKTGQKIAAIDALERYIAIAPKAQDVRDAELILRQVRESIN